MNGKEPTTLAERGKFICLEWMVECPCCGKPLVLPMTGQLGIFANREDAEAIAQGFQVEGKPCRVIQVAMCLIPAGEAGTLDPELFHDPASA